MMLRHCLKSWWITRIDYTWEFMLINPSGFAEGTYSTEREAMRARKLYMKQF